MKLQRILIPTDFSERSHFALEWGASLARDTGASLIIVHVHEPENDLIVEGGFAVVDMPTNLDALNEEVQREKPTDDDIPCEHHVLVGPPAKEIVGFAREKNCDLIVMSTHGRKGFAHFLMGSVAEAVVRSAHCPVMTIKADSPPRESVQIPSP